MLEEAIAKWPSDVALRPADGARLRDVRPGRAKRSARSSVISPRTKTTPKSLFLGVEWIYQLHSAGAAAHSPAEDLKLARSYADAYTKTKGPQAALVKQWMEFLERK